MVYASCVTAEETRSLAGGKDGEENNVGGADDVETVLFGLVKSSVRARSHLEWSFGLYLLSDYASLVAMWNA